MLAIEKPQSHLDPAEKIIARSVKLRIVDLDQSRTHGLAAYSPANFTDAQIGEVDEKQIVIPSMFSMSKLIATHFNTLDKLKRRLLLLKQAYLK